MVKKVSLTLTLLAVLIVALLGSASVAYASGSDQVEGTGWLHAQGDGLAFLRGTGWVKVKGNGVLWVKGAEHIYITGKGHSEHFADGWVEYCGFQGTARIRGRSIAVIIAGEDVVLDAIGHGRVDLWGEGSYRVGSSMPVSWDSAPHPINY